MKHFRYMVDRFTTTDHNVYRKTTHDIWKQVRLSLRNYEVKEIRDTILIDISTLIPPVKPI